MVLQAGLVEEVGAVVVMTGVHRKREKCPGVGQDLETVMDRVGESTGQPRVCCVEGKLLKVPPSCWVVGVAILVQTPVQSLWHPRLIAFGDSSSPATFLSDRS